MKSMLRAFPLKDPRDHDYQGMTLRDYFAAEAMPIVFGQLISYNTGDIDERMKVAARLAYEFADEMMAQKKKEDKS